MTFEETGPRFNAANVYRVSMLIKKYVIQKYYII